MALAVPEIDRRVVSTDHAEIARAAQAAGLDAPFLRPADISGDRIGDWDVLEHALQATEQLDATRYDIVVMLQPTSPLRRAEDVSSVIRMLVEGNYDSVWSVSETDLKAHPLKQLVVREGRMGLWDERGARSSRVSSSSRSFIATASHTRSRAPACSSRRRSWARAPVHTSSRASTSPSIPSRTSN